MARTFRIASIAAILAGASWVAWVAINMATGGGLDAGPPAVQEITARAGRALIVGYNVCLIPAALVLWRWLKPGRPELAALASVCGLTSLCLWAGGAAVERITPRVEVTYLALSGIWWCGLGVMLWSRTRVFGAFTLVLGTFALWDSLLTALWPVPFSMYLTAAPKVPLSIVWDFALAIALWRWAAHVSRDNLAWPAPTTI
jgi:hypothetical protein